MLRPAFLLPLSKERLLTPRSGHRDLSLCLGPATRRSDAYRDGGCVNFRAQTASASSGAKGLTSASPQPVGSTWAVNRAKLKAKSTAARDRSRRHRRSRPERARPPTSPSLPPVPGGSTSPSSSSTLLCLSHRNRTVLGLNGPAHDSSREPSRGTPGRQGARNACENLGPDPSPISSGGVPGGPIASWRFSGQIR